jgi:hypothetical protein
MASDITLAVGAGARRMTYGEIAESRRISVSSAERLVRRKHWRRQVGNDGVVRILIPLDDTQNPKEHTDPDNRDPVRTTRSAVRTSDDVRGTIRTLEAAVRTLGEQLQVANKSLIDERKRVDELLHQLADAPEKGPETDPLPAIAIQTLSQAVEMLREDVAHERERADQAERRIDELLHDLADARTAAMITGCEAAALRAENALLKARPWWRRWFR